MLTIQRSFWADKKAAVDAGVDVPTVCTKVGLYQAIAAHLGIDTTGLDIDMLWSAIDAKNQDLACTGIAEHLVKNESTVVDKMAAVIDQPAVTIAGVTMKAVKFDRPVAVPPVKRPVPVVKGGLDIATMRPGVKTTVQRPKLRVR